MGILVPVGVTLELRCETVSVWRRSYCTIYFNFLVQHIISITILQYGNVNANE